MCDFQPLAIVVSITLTGPVEVIAIILLVFEIDQKCSLQKTPIPSVGRHISLKTLLFPSLYKFLVS